ncbi:MAG: GMC family oxidoreductase [Myxococcaceae bacterium]|nr:GMC family oxidoreductase [Myxococcaceae bacterium]
MNFPSGQTVNGDSFTTDETLTCDAVIIGSGAGGAAAAWQMTQAGLSVAVLEEGRKFEPHQIATKQSWALRNLYAERGTSVSMGNIFLPMARGRVVGGSTFLNAAICFRTPKKVLDVWQRDYGIDWADAEALAPTFEEVERAIGVTKTRPDQAKTHSLLFKQGVEALGLEGDFISRNAPACIGCGICQFGCPMGFKGSVDRNLIPFALQKGAALFPCTRAVSLLVENGAAVGVEAYGVEPLSEERRRKLTFRAKKVFLCAGSIGSPLFLLRSGVANGSGQVGENLRVHLAAGVVGRFEQVVDMWHGAQQGYYAHLPGKNAVLETFSATPEVFATQYSEYSKPLKHLRDIASCGVMIGDVSKGSVKLARTESRSNMSYDVEREDHLTLLAGFEAISRVYFAAGARDVHLGIPGVGKLSKMSDVEKITRRTDLPVDELAMYASHPMGTVRMHADKKLGVVKPDGETHEVKNLIVADASVFPTSLGVNPQISVMTTSVTITRQQLKVGA